MIKKQAIAHIKSKLQQVACVRNARMWFSRFEPKGCLKQQIRFRRPYILRP